MALSSKIRVGVLRGGPSHEHEISIKTGGQVLKSLSEKYQPADIFIDRFGAWHFNGIVEAPVKIFKKVDVLFNALHGEYGEDGTIQNLLETFGVPYTGSGRIASAFAMHKVHAKNFLKSYGIKSPYHKLLKKDQLTKQVAFDLWHTVMNPSVVKPVSLGSSVGVSVARSFAEFETALEKAFSQAESALIEEYISGREATCGIIDNFRDQNEYALLPVEIAPTTSSFFDYDAKYAKGAELFHPGRFSAMEKTAIQDLARTVHRSLCLRHYSRSDFIVSPKRGIYFLEVNSLPGLYADSPYAESLLAVGSSLPEFLDHVLMLALGGK
jgi:D-alanine-D-alanine ligase